MASFYHVMKKNKGRAFPRNWIFVDTETRPQDFGKGRLAHRLVCGVACYERDPRPRNPGKLDWYDFTNAQDFWLWALGVAEPDRRLVVIAYNAGFDVRILDTFKSLRVAGYEQGTIFVSQGCCILTFRRGKHVVAVYDMMNWVTGTLEDWGKMLRIPKKSVSFRHATDAQLLVRCRRDVEILRAVWHKWRAFVTDNDLGHFTPTVSAQALTAFRHRFMRDKIVLHANPEATAVEREAYTGGRVEAYHIGDVPGGPFTVLDVNSMYPYVMSRTPVPVQLLRVVDSPPVHKVREAVRRFALIAEVALETPLPIYPVRRSSKLVWPTGRFRAVLCGPELLQALCCGHVRAFGRVLVYRTAIIFAPYVKALYALRASFREAGNPVFAEMAKKMLNCLYGKFGQHSEKWSRSGVSPHLFDQSMLVFVEGDADPHRVYIIDGTVWRVEGREEAVNSFPAISAFITSAARMYLWRLIAKAGRENVFYTDTDSLIVNAPGAKRLRPLCRAGDLGALKVEYVTRKLTVHGAKEYETDRAVKRKGISKDAEQIAPRVWRMYRWEGLTGAFASGNLDCVVLTPQVKNLSSVYDKGVVSASGSVSPLVLAEL